MSESLEQRALRIRGEIEDYFKGLLNGLPQAARIDFNDPVVLSEFARRLMAEQGEPVAEVVQMWGSSGGMTRMLPGVRTPPIGTKLYASPPQDALEAFLKECEAEAAHIEKNGSTLRTKFGDEHEGRCRELCATYLREFVSSYRIGQRIAAIDAAMQETSNVR